MSQTQHCMRKLCQVTAKGTHAAGHPSGDDLLGAREERVHHAAHVGKGVQRGWVHAVRVRLVKHLRAH